MFYPPYFFLALFCRHLLPNCQKIKPREKNCACYIFRKVEDSTTTAGSSVELLTIGGYRPGSCILLTFSRRFSAAPSPECSKNKNRAKKTVLSIFSWGLKTLLLQQAHPSTC